MPDQVIQMESSEMKVGDVIAQGKTCRTRKGMYMGRYMDQLEREAHVLDEIFIHTYPSK